MPKKRSSSRPQAAALPDSGIKLPRIWHGVQTAIAPADRAPFAIEAVVVEDDTWQVLGAEPEFRPTAEHPIRLMQALHDAEPLEPGSVVIREGVPTRLHAIVHDLEREPSWKEEWISAALVEILAITSRRGYRALGLPLLGTVHARLPRDRALHLLSQALTGGSVRPLRRLWLVSPRRR